MCLGTSVRYFFYVTNDRDLTAKEVVFHANERCNQENLSAQLKGGVNSLKGPLIQFVANWALMVMASLAWSLKAWLALTLPEQPEQPEQHEVDINRILRMDFRTFVLDFIQVPTQILLKGRQLIYRALAWRPNLALIFRAAEGSG
jgi:hypothetical protein